MSSKITIVDYSMGNIGSVVNMIRKIGFNAQVARTTEDIRSADKLLLPGVGSFDSAIKELEKRNFIEVLNEQVLGRKTPVLGICLGMQLLTKGSEEGVKKGLGWIDAETIRFPRDNGMKVPHMGWNEVHSSNESPLTFDLNKMAKDKTEVPRFYFVHSYYVKVSDAKNSILKTTYGLEFDSAIQDQNVMGCQFHPEKSHKFGMQLLSNFAQL